MTDIEALLSVDAGRTPPGCVAFFRRDADQGARRVSLALTLIAAAIVVGLIAGGVGRVPVALIALGAALLALRATPTLPPPEEQSPTRQVLVITPNGIILRDTEGLRRWGFDELAAVESIHQERPYLVLVQNDGHEHVIDYLSFQRGRRMHAAIDGRRAVAPPSSPTAR